MKKVRFPLTKKVDTNLIEYPDDFNLFTNVVIVDGYVYAEYSGSLILDEVGYIPNIYAKPIPITKLTFIRLLKDFGAGSPEALVTATKDLDLEYFWLVFDMAAELEKFDPELNQALSVIETKGYITDKQAVLDNWPTG